MYRLPLILLFFTVFSAPVPAATGAALTWQDSIDVTHGRGEKGPWQQNDSRYDYVDDPTVAIEEDGTVDVAWVEQGRKDVFFQRFSATGERQLAQPVNVSVSPETFSWLPRLVRAQDSSETIYIVWQEIIFAGGSHGGDILFARSLDNGATFSKPINLSASVGGDGKGRINRDTWHNGSFTIMAARDGELYVAWTEYDGLLWISRSVDRGKSFSRPKRVAGGGNDKPARAPALALGRDRTLYLAWTTGEDTGADIHVAKSTDRGATFSTPHIVAPGNTYSDAPKLAVTPDGALHLVYAESKGGPFDKCQIRYTHSSDGGRTFAPPREISTPLPPAAESAGFPMLRTDAAGRLYVTFELFPDAKERPRGIGMVVSQDGGKNFTPVAVVPGSSDAAGGTNGSHQGLLMSKLAVSRYGAVVIANSSLVPGQKSRVWLMRGAMVPAAGR